MDVRIPALSRRQLFGAAAACVVLLLLVVRHLGGGGSPAPAVTPVQPVAKPKAVAQKLLVVDVAGAVRHPGVYRLPLGSAGRRRDRRGGRYQAEGAARNREPRGADRGRRADRRPGRGVAVSAAGGAPAAGPSSSAPLDLNSATLEELENLPGIGPVTAQKILDYRQQHGAFHSVAELQGVPGIGPAHMAQLKGLVIP